MLRARPSNVMAHCAQYYLRGRGRAQRLDKGLRLSTDLNPALRINHHTSVHFAFFKTGGYLDSAPEGTGIPIILTVKASGPQRVSPGILTPALGLLWFLHFDAPTISSVPFGEGFRVEGEQEIEHDVEQKKTIKLAMYLRKSASRDFASVRGRHFSNNRGFSTVKSR